MPDALSLQLGDVLLQCCPRIPERGPGAGGRQSGDFVIGQPDDAHPGPAYRPDKVGAYAAPGQRAALLRRQIGGQHRQGLGLQETGQFAASFVELMIAQGHGVVGQQRVRSGDHGPFVDAVEQSALELVARVQGDDVVLLLSGSLDGCADASQTAAAVRGLETGVHVLIDTGKKGMGIIHVQEAQLQTCIRGCLAVRRSAGNHEEEKSTGAAFVPVAGDAWIYPFCLPDVRESRRQHDGEGPQCLPGLCMEASVAGSHGEAGHAQAACLCLPWGRMAAAERYARTG